MVNCHFFYKIYNTVRCCWLLPDRGLLAGLFTHPDWEEFVKGICCFSSGTVKPMVILCHGATKIQTFFHNFQSCYFPFWQQCMALVLWAWLLHPFILHVPLMQRTATLFLDRSFASPILLPCLFCLLHFFSTQSMSRSFFAEKNNTRAGIDAQDSHPEPYNPKY